MQKIVYAKGSSDIIAKLRGTYNPTAAAAQGVSTDLQKSIFNAPPSAATIAAPAPTAAVGAAPNSTDEGPKGTKRPREEESEGEAPMDEESDVPMEDSSDEE